MIHFIYRVPQSENRWMRKLEKLEWTLIRKQNRLIYTSWRKGGKFLYRDTLRAPYSITVNLHTYLAQNTKTRLYDLFEPGGLKYGQDDIIIGHPWMDSGTIVQEAILNPAPCRLKALIFPIHHRIPEINYYARPLVERADIVFGIMGPYWYDTIDQSEFASWKSKLVRLDMAIDTKAFPYLKNKFNPPGKRGYLYIGRNSVEKGPEILAQTMAGLQTYPRGWIGPGEAIPNIEREAEFVELTPEYISTLATKYDFFINTSVSDANPTTILEAMAWGFPVACTPESGYYNMPSLIQLSTVDIASNINILHNLQYWPEEKLIELSQTNRRLVENFYTWERFCSTVWQHLENYL